ncbi:site-specific integrase [Desulfopila inferna]|uniref:site-specific integrase n=1 Tax=Desulfopila inferna TaxID=468528 RepID=UPI00338E76EB
MTALPRHWKPYFQFAFCSGLRQGEQFALKPGDIDPSKGCLTISRAMTLGLDGQRIEGKTKNRFSRREIQLLPAMKSVLETQLAICKQLKAEYLFCTENGCRINHADLSTRVWQPPLIAAGISYRPMVQTRHSFATTALSLGENPLWIAHVMGHRDTDMIVRVYAKLIKIAVNNRDGGELSNLHSTMIGNCG